MSRGWVPSTVAGYLHDHPVAQDDVVHVEDGAWVNADGDFGAPSFLNWSWPLMGASGVEAIARHLGDAAGRGRRRPQERWL